jgi:hypothetical protein
MSAPSRFLTLVGCVIAMVFRQLDLLRDRST